MTSDANKVVEKNRIIAEFMGLNEAEDEYPKGLPKGVELWGNFMDNGDKIRYHESWDWLMPVVEKIESLGYIVSIDKNTCHILMNGVTLFDKSMKFQGSSKIEAVYTAVVEFINWYNTPNHERHGN